MKRVIEQGFNWKRYLVSFFGIAILMAGSLHYWSTRFTSVDLKKLVDTPSRSKILTTNPCQFQVRGEPGDSGKHYVKVQLKCKNGISNNTLSLKPLTLLSFEEVMKMLGRVDNFDPNLILDNLGLWSCESNGKKLTRNEIINPTDQINCEQN